MSLPFETTLRSLAAERVMPPALAWSLGTLLLLLWGGWLVLAQVPLTVAAVRARLVSAAPPQVLAAAADGTVEALELRAGAEVRAGQVLAVLDSPPLRNRLRQARARREALRSELASAADQVRAARTAVAENALAAAAQGAQLAAEERRAATAADLAERERRRRALLEAAGLLSAAEAERSRAEAEELAAAAEGLSFARWASGRERRAGAAGRCALLDQATGEEARLRGELAATTAEVAELAGELAGLVVRAPFAGRLGTPSRFHAGSPVRRGDPLLTVEPAGACRVLAELPAASRSALRVGQPARVTLAAAGPAPRAVFAATVAALAAAPAGGSATVEVELAPAGGAPPSAVPLLAGTPCAVEVELARATPAALLLQALGRRPAGTPEPLPRRP